MIKEKLFTMKFLRTFPILLVLASIFLPSGQTATAQESPYSLLWSRGFDGLTIVDADWGHIAATSSESGYRAYLFDREGNLQIRDYRGSDICSAYAPDQCITADGRYILAFTRNETNFKVTYPLSLFDSEGNLLWSYDIGVYSFNTFYDFPSMAMTPDGKYIVAAGGYQSKYIYLLDELGSLLWKDEACLMRVAIADDGGYIAGASYENDVSLFDRQGKLLWSQRLTDRIEQIALAIEGSLFVATTGGDYLFDKLGNILGKCPVYGGLTPAIAVSPDGNYVADASGPGFFLFNKQGEFLEQSNIRLEGNVVEIAIGTDKSIIAFTEGEEENWYRPSDVVYFFDGQGTLLWSYDVGVEAVAQKITHPRICAAVSPDMSSICVLVRGIIYKLNLLDIKCKPLWSQEVEGEPIVISRTTDLGQIILGTTNKVYFFDMQGSILQSWSYEVKGTIVSMKIALDGNYIGILSLEEQFIVTLFDREGRLLWSYDKIPRAQYVWLLVGPEGSVSVHRAASASGHMTSRMVTQTWIGGVYQSQRESFTWQTTEPGYHEVLFFNRQGKLLPSNEQPSQDSQFQAHYIINSTGDGVSIFDPAGNLVLESKNTGVKAYVDSQENYILLAEENTFHIYDVKGQLFGSYDYSLGRVLSMQSTPDGNYLLLESNPRWSRDLYLFDSQVGLLWNHRVEIESGVYYDEPGAQISANGDYVIERVGYDTEDKVYLFTKSEWVAPQRIAQVKSLISRALSEGYDILDNNVQYYLSAAENALSAGNHSAAISLAEDAMREAETNYRLMSTNQNISPQNEDSSVATTNWYLLGSAVGLLIIIVSIYIVRRSYRRRGK